MYYLVVYSQWIRMCAVILNTQADYPPCCLWHASEHLWIHGAKGILRSSAQIIVAGSVSLHQQRTPQEVVRGGKVGNKRWPS